MCSVCLPQLYKSPAFVECPTCREVNAVRVEQVPKNRDILEFLEYFKSQQQQQQPSANETTSTTSSSNITSIPTTTTTTTERPPLNETPISSNYQHSSPEYNNYFNLNPNFQNRSLLIYCFNFPVGMKANT